MRYPWKCSYVMNTNNVTLHPRSETFNDDECIERIPKATERRGNLLHFHFLKYILEVLFDVL